ncbi:MAG: type transport system ATP-binding protein [Clostridia bacterium]|nr:type transport system ATP-binding protein [Clostridia bacterium]
MTVVEAVNLSKRYGRTWALRGVNLVIEEGMVVGLLGPNGSGKSTFLRLLAGLSHPSGGEVKVLGERPGLATKKQVAFVPEIDHLYRWMRVRDTLDFQAGFYADFDPARGEELLTFMNLDPGARVYNLSKGQRARLKLMLALARQARLVLLDEPFSGIDPPSRERILQGILMAYRQDRTVIISTHLVGEVEKLFDQVVFLSQGEVFLAGEAESLRAERGKSIDEIFREEYR